MITIFGGAAVTFGIFILKKLDSFSAMFSNVKERISCLETLVNIFHGKK